VVTSSLEYLYLLYILLCCLQINEMKLYLADICTIHDNAGAIVFAHLDFHDGSDVRHDDCHRNVEVVAMVGERKSVVTCTGRYHSLLLLFLEKPDNTQYGITK